ncbi:MAG TPA: class I SAM-dependent methyltransferase [Hyphomicrobium sp.]|nr:class I SAM-dependent methyltransferase [Hyphomicrobium sp.]
MASNLKAAIKPFIPAPLLDRWKRYRFNVEQNAVRGRPLDEVFNEIYARGTWRPAGSNATFHSGPGSVADVTEGYEVFVADVIDADPSIRRIVDIGCGDFQVSERILARLQKPVTYVGCDIASLVVADNEARHAVAGRIEFRNLNVATDPLPDGDIVTIREVFQHLSNDTIAAALANLRRTFRRAIVTEAVPVEPSKPNLDIASGYRTRDGLRSGVYLELAPFGLEIEDRYEVRVASANKVEVLRTLVVKL